NTIKTLKTTDVKSGVIEKSFADNEQVNVVLSNRDINRVLVKADKIQSINGPTGLYTAKNDVSGSVYISLYGEVPFTVFASTVKGHNFSLLITPRAVTGRTVILEPTSPSLLTARFEETDGYQKLLVTLINGMINSEALEDYAYGEIKKSKKTSVGVVSIKPIASYSGSHLLGIISEVKNKSKAPIALKPSYFYKPGVRAVALSQQMLGPSETGLLYQVIGRE
ncbi:MAG: IncF plasmid conjugative transfer pilus assembly protein TraK, partial [uncultured bacterium]